MHLPSSSLQPYHPCKLLGPKVPILAFTAVGAVSGGVANAERLCTPGRQAMHLSWPCIWCISCDYCQAWITP